MQHLSRGTEHRFGELGFSWTAVRYLMPTIEDGNKSPIQHKELSRDRSPDKADAKAAWRSPKLECGTSTPHGRTREVDRAGSRPKRPYRAATP